MHYPLQVVSRKFEFSHKGLFEYGYAIDYIKALQKKSQYCCNRFCSVTSYGMLFISIERELGEYASNEYALYAEYLIASIVQYESGIWNWIDSDVIRQMIEGVTFLRLNRVFYQMLKYNPLIILGEEVIYTVLRYGTYEMMECVLELCECEILDITEIEIVPKNIIKIEICPPNTMHSDAGNFFKHKFIDIPKYVNKNNGYATIGLKVNDEIILKYGDNIEEVLAPKKYDTNVNKNKQCTIF